MEETIVKDGKKLRLGYTTGSCAAAAAKAAAWMLLTGKRKENISLQTPKGILLNLKVHHIEIQPDSVSCSIEKDSGDDPDITRGTHIFAKVQFAPDGESRVSGRNPFESQVVIEGGQGVGRVTKPGLDQPVGNAAINSVPRKMIRENVEEVCRTADYSGKIYVIISVPEGEKLAKKTFNPRLGIVGGISILGTTGIVEPMSEDSILETIRIELRQKREQGEEYILLTPGNYGIDFIRDGLKKNPDSAVMVSNFIGDALAYCAELKFKGILLVGHIGKLVKLAGGMMNTHSKYGDCRMEIIAANAAASGLDREHTAQILECVTCDDALKIIREADSRFCTGKKDLTGIADPAGSGDQAESSLSGIYEKTLDRLSRRIELMMTRKAFDEVRCAAIIFSRETGLLCETEAAEELLCRF